MISRKVWIFLPIVLYVLAINPFLAPSTYDNVTYWKGAQSLVNQGTYTFNGYFIVDWPPGVSFLIAIPQLFGLTGVAWAKVAIIMCVLISAYVTLTILKKEDYPFPYLTTAVFLIIPCSFIWGTRIMSEWPFTMWAFLFLVLIDKIKNSLSLSLLSGVFLGLALLTRYIGVALFIPLIVIVFQRFEWKRGLKEVILSYECLAGITGCLVFTCFWLIPIMWLKKQGVTTQSNYDLSLFSDMNPLGLFELTPKLFLSSGLYGKIPISISLVIKITLNLLIGFGFVSNVRKNGLKYTDWYVLMTLAILCLKVGKFPRYLIPIAPFLLSYFFYGIYELGKVANLRENKTIFRMAKIFCACWIILLISINSTLLIYGNGKQYNGLSYILNNSEQTFYRNYWKDLYQVSEQIKQSSVPGSIQLKNLGDTRYIHFFSQRKVVSKNESEEPAFLIVGKKQEHIKADSLPDFTVFNETDYFIVYQRIRDRI